MSDAISVTVEPRPRAAGTRVVIRGLDVCPTCAAPWAGSDIGITGEPPHAYARLRCVEGHLTVIQARPHQAASA